MTLLLIHMRILHQIRLQLQNFNHIKQYNQIMIHLLFLYNILLVSHHIIPSTRIFKYSSNTQVTKSVQFQEVTTAAYTPARVYHLTTLLPDILLDFLYKPFQLILRHIVCIVQTLITRKQVKITTTNKML